MPCRGSMANCMTLERMVMAPTARSPPYFSREALKHTEMTLSLACMMKVAVPRATQGRISRGRMGRDAFSSRSRVCFPRRKVTTHTQDTAWDSTVARAAPRTPMSRAKMNRGSSRMLHTAPMRTVFMPTWAKPWAVMKAFRPRVSSTNRVPRA